MGYNLAAMSKLVKFRSDRSAHPAHLDFQKAIINSPIIDLFFCQGKVDVVMGCLGLGAPLQRSFKCLKKGGTAFVTEEINEKVLKSLQKLADQNNVKIVEKPTGSVVGTVDDLKNLLNLVAEKQVMATFRFLCFGNVAQRQVVSRVRSCESSTFRRCTPILSWSE